MYICQKRSSSTRFCCSSQFNVITIDVQWWSATLDHVYRQHPLPLHPDTATSAAWWPRPPSEAPRSAPGSSRHVEDSELTSPSGTSVAARASSVRRCSHRRPVNWSSRAKLTPSSESVHRPEVSP